MARVVRPNPREKDESGHARLFVAFEVNIKPSVPGNPLIGASTNEPHTSELNCGSSRCSLTSTEG